MGGHVSDLIPCTFVLQLLGLIIHLMVNIWDVNKHYYIYIIIIIIIYIQGQGQGGVIGWKRSGQIPAFGDWEHVNQLPITQYFESARDAGLVRHHLTHTACTSSTAPSAAFSSGEHCCHQLQPDHGCLQLQLDPPASWDLYATAHHSTHWLPPPPPLKKAGRRGREKRRVSGVHQQEEVAWPTREAAAAATPRTTLRRRKQQRPLRQAAAAAAAAAARKKVFDFDVTVEQQQQQQLSSASASSSSSSSLLYTSAASASSNKRHPTASSAAGTGNHPIKDTVGVAYAPPHHPPPRSSKAVDEDLYKIPPHLLRSSHRVKLIKQYSSRSPF
ncbi:hypothetical protein Dimus_011928 [Dionaea muscipula]